MLFRSIFAFIFSLSSCTGPTANQQDVSDVFPKAEQVIIEMASGVMHVQLTITTK